MKTSIFLFFTFVATFSDISLAQLKVKIVELFEADIDGDGKMEIAVFREYCEGAWVMAFEIENGNAKTILQTGCGA